jgi:hypothetical protein
MVDFAEALYLETDGVLANGDDHFEHLWREALRILEAQSR